jgi:hypothetical protein
MDIQIVPNYLPNDKFLALQAYARNNDDWVITPENPLWSNRTIQHDRVKNTQVHTIMSELEEDMIKSISDHFNLKKKLTADFFGVVRKYPSPSEPYHSDSSGNNGEDNGTSHRVFSSLLYLNDDFDGGELLFHNHNLTIKPEPNLAVFFPSSFEYIHSVQELRSGTRYNLTMFWKYKESE